MNERTSDMTENETALPVGQKELAEAQALLRRWRETDAFTISYIESLLADLGRDFTKLSFTF